MAELRFAYAARGYDYAGAIERVAGDEELLHSLLDMFAADSSFLKLMSALDAHDALEGFHAAHSLKGSSGMLGMTGLFEAMKLITEPLPSGKRKYPFSFAFGAPKYLSRAMFVIK